jgi:thymidylate synthase (FAD)
MEEVFDIAVSGPYHNFIAGGVAVHNSVNEMSGRFGQLPELVYVPEDDQVAYQDPKNKQGRGVLASSAVANKFKDTIRVNALRAFEDYHQFLGCADYEDATSTFFASEEYEEIKTNGGISRELARIDLPLNTYTQWAWKIDLHNLLHFLELRLDEHAQWEIRQYAKVMATMVATLCPIAWEAFVDYRLETMTLSRLEIEVLKTILAVQDKSQMPAWNYRISTCARELLSSAELKKFQQKLQVLGFSDVGPDGG